MIIQTPPGQAAAFNSQYLDAAGRTRVAEPYTLFDGTFTATLNTVLFDSAVVSGATVTHLPNQSSARLTTPTTSGAKATLQTRRYFEYQPGKSFLIKASCVLGSPKSNVRQRLGYFDANNGLFFEQTGSGLSVVRRSKVTGSVVDEITTQANWNLDRLDGTGPSRITLDTSLSSLFVIDFQWLGVGRVRFGFLLNGYLIYCHEILNTNVVAAPFMGTAVLPVRYEIENTGTAASSTSMDVICASVQSEGGYQPNGVTRYASNGTTTKSVGGSGTFVPIISLRKSSSFVALPVRIEAVGLFMNSVDEGEVVCFMNPSLTGASWAAAPGSSLCERDVSATAITGGQQVAGGYIRGGGGTESKLQLAEIFSSVNMILGSSLAGASDIFTVALRNISSGSTALANIQYKEFVQ